MTLPQLGPLGKELPWFMESKCKKDHVIGRIIREFLLRPTPLCAAIGSIIKEIGRREISCHCRCQSDTQKFLIDIYGRNARVTECGRCRRRLTMIRGMDPKFTTEQFGRLFRNQNEFGRIWEANTQDGEDWDADHAGPVQVRVRTWRRVADIVDLNTMEFID